MWEYKHSDELYHWKYIKKVKTANGKWRYIYDADELGKDLNNAANNIASNVGTAVETLGTEGSRQLDNVTYDLNRKKIELEKQYKLGKVNNNKTDSQLMKDLKVSSIIVSNRVKTETNDFLKRLNNYGDGKMDNKIRDVAKKGADFFKSLFGK